MTLRQMHLGQLRRRCKGALHPAPWASCPVTPSRLGISQPHAQATCMQDPPALSTTPLCGHCLPSPRHTLSLCPQTDSRYRQGAEILDRALAGRASPIVQRIPKRARCPGATAPGRRCIPPSNNLSRQCKTLVPSPRAPPAAWPSSATALRRANTALFRPDTKPCSI